MQIFTNRNYLYVLVTCMAALLVYNGVSMEFLQPTIILLLCLPILAQLIGKNALCSNAGNVLVLLFSAWIFATIFWSEAPDSSFIGFARISLLPLSYFAMLAVLQGKDLNTILLPLWRLLLAIIFIFALFPILDQLVVGKTRSGGLLYDANLAANIINILIISLLLLLLFKFMTRLQYALLLVVLFIATLGFAYGESRSALIALSPALLVAMLVATYQFGLIGMLRRIVLPAASILLAMLVTAQAGISTGARLGVDGVHINSGRLYMWQGAWQWFLEKPFLGTGIYTYNSLYASVRVESTERGFYAHNDYVQMLMETGVLGLALLLALGLLCLYFIYQACRDYLSNHELRALILLALNLWVLAFFVQALVYFVFYNSHIMFAVGMVFALSSYAYLPQKPSSNQYKMLRPTLSLALILFCSSIFLDAYYMQRQYTIIKNNDVATMHQFELMNIGKAYPKYTLAQIYLTISRNNANTHQQQQLALEYSQDRICQYIQRSPYNFGSYYLLAQVYNRFLELNLELKPCNAPLPQNSAEAVERAIDVAPFETLPYYNDLKFLLRDQPEQLQRIKTKELATTLLVVDFANNNSWAKARANALNKADEYNKRLPELIANYNKQPRLGNAGFFQTIFASVDALELAGK